jgi:hypothetical protein
VLAEKKSKKMQNTQDDYDEALASDDPTLISNQDLENMAKEAVKKFKSLG